MKNYLFLIFLFCCFSLNAQSKKSVKKSTKEFRTHYKADFLKNERSPFYNKKSELKKLRFFRPKSKYRVECTFHRTPDEKPFEMATYSGKVKPFIKFGILTFKIAGKQHHLAVYQNLKYKKISPEHLFLPFKDLTCNKKTYGGGRYIDLKLTDIKGTKVTLDFNQAYNPWCAFSGGYNCPVPPKENHLPIAIKAGEKKFKKSTKK